MKNIPVFAISRLRPGTDGTGLRTLIGIYGCPLKCKYCINPHSWNGTVKPDYYTSEQLYEKINIDSLYFKATGGGVTFGGGEPACYGEFIAEFIKEYCKGWNVDLETSLNVPQECIEPLDGLVNRYIVDIKDIDAEVYKRYTSKDNLKVINNLRYLIQKGYKDSIVVRVPLIKGFNDPDLNAKTEVALKNIGIKCFEHFEYIIKDGSI